MLKESYKKCLDRLDELKSNAKFSSILIKNDKEFYLNFHDNEDKIIYSFLFDKQGNIVNEEKIKEEFRELKEEDIIKENEIEKIENIYNNLQNKDKKDIIISKKEGDLRMVEFDLENKTITEFSIKENKKEIQKFKFNDIFKF